jgi:hypothetical protein
MEWVAAHTGGQMICAWGSNVKGLSRPVEVLEKLRSWGVTPLALRVNGDGMPAHPVMLPYACVPVEI